MITGRLTWCRAVSPSTLAVLMSAPWSSSWTTSSLSPERQAARKTQPELNLILRPCSCRGWGRRGLCPTPPSASAARRASSSPSCCVRPARTSWQILLGQTNDLLLQIILLLAAEHALCKIDRLLQVCVDFVCSAVVSLLLYRNCFIALLFAMGIGF